jgi:hypothetical protein
MAAWIFVALLDAITTSNPSDAASSATARPIPDES